MSDPSMIQLKVMQLKHDSRTYFRSTKPHRTGSHLTEHLNKQLSTASAYFADLPLCINNKSQLKHPLSCFPAQCDHVWAVTASLPRTKPPKFPKCQHWAQPFPKSSRGPGAAAHKGAQGSWMPPEQHGARKLQQRDLWCNNFTFQSS